MVLNNAVCLTNSFVLSDKCKTVSYESLSLNGIVADKSHWFISACFDS